MKTNAFLIIALLFLLGCEFSPKSTDSNDKKSNESTLKSEKIEVQIISDWPDEIEGCSCYSSRNKNEFEKGQYIYMDDYGDLALMKINGRFERFKLTQSDTLETSYYSRETWTNKDFEITIETKQIGQIEETWQHIGKLILKTSTGKVVEQELYGECGC